MYNTGKKSHKWTTFQGGGTQLYKQQSVEIFLLPSSFINISLVNRNYISLILELLGIAESAKYCFFNITIKPLTKNKTSKIRHIEILNKTM